MNEIGKHIVLNQDSNKNIKRLASQNQIYSVGKTTFAFQVLIAVPIPIVISLVPLFWSHLENQLAWIFILFSIIATFLEFYFDDRGIKLKKRAASIQEKFDCDVLVIEWNKTLLPKKIGDDIVYRYYKQYVKKKKLKELYGWYSKEVEPVNTNVATLICQRINCSYDFSLRNRYTRTIMIITISTFLILFIIAGSFDAKLPIFITSVLFPSLPVFVLAYKQISSNKDSIENLEELKELIENELTGLKINDEVSTQLIRQIQDKIYLKRINSPLLPEWAYKFLRQNLEDEMNFSVSEKVKELS